MFSIFQSGWIPNIRTIGSSPSGAASNQSDHSISKAITRNEAVDATKSPHTEVVWEGYGFAQKDVSGGLAQKRNPPKYSASHIISFFSLSL